MSNKFNILLTSIESNDKKGIEKESSNAEA